MPINIQNIINMDTNNPNGLKQVEVIINQLQKEAASLNQTLQALLSKQDALNASTKKSSEAYKTLADQIDKTKGSLKTITDEINKGMQALAAYRLPGRSHAPGRVRHRSVPT